MKTIAKISNKSEFISDIEIIKEKGIEELTFVRQGKNIITINDAVISRVIKALKAEKNIVIPAKTLIPLKSDHDEISPNQLKMFDL